MKFAIPVIALSFLLAVGCQQQQKKPTTDSAALDVAPAASPVAYSSPAPVQTAMPDPALSSPAPTNAANSSGTYTVQKGDTLWKIAATHLGSGKKWKEIADANPGLTPSALRAGQTITMPQ